jgi:hypothetical protein
MGRTKSRCKAKESYLSIYTKKMITATNTFKEFEIIPAGTFIARCVSMIHIGTVEEKFNNESKFLNKVSIKWELPTELKVYKPEEGERPLTISKKYTLSMSTKANLRKDLESWRGKAFSDLEAESFDISNLLGKPCMLSIVHTTKGEKTYANIASVIGVPKGVECPKQINETFEFSLENFSKSTFDKVPEYLQKQIMESKEFKSIAFPEDLHVDQTFDDVPF